MQITFAKTELQKWIGIPLRIFTVCWPFITEALALVWWMTSVEVEDLLKSAMLVVAFGFLCFSPQRLVFSFVGIGCAILIIGITGSAIGEVLRSGLKLIDVQSMTLVDFAFGLIWGIVIYLLRAPKQT